MGFAIVPRGGLCMRSVWSGQKVEPNAWGSAGMPDRAHPPKCDSHFPAQCCLFPAQKGAGWGEKKRHNDVENTRVHPGKILHEKHSHPFI